MNAENTNKKIIVMSFLAAGVLMAIVVSVLFETLAASFAPVARARGIDALRHGLPIGLGFLTFFALQLNAQVRVWADEVVTETLKVVWPSRKDTIGMTIVVCVMVLLAGIGFGVFDFVSSHLMKLLLH